MSDLPEPPLSLMRKYWQYTTAEQDAADSAFEAWRLRRLTLDGEPDYE